MNGIPVKKLHVFLKKPKQICVKLHGYKRKTFLLSWKRSELVDKKKNWEQFSGL